MFSVPSRVEETQQVFSKTIPVGIALIRNNWSFFLGRDEIEAVNMYGVIDFIYTSVVSYGTILGALCTREMSCWATVQCACDRYVRFVCYAVTVVYLLGTWRPLHAYCCTYCYIWNEVTMGGLGLWNGPYQVSSEWCDNYFLYRRRAMLGFVRIREAVCHIYNVNILTQQDRFVRYEVDVRWQ